jgi:glycine C-acetyltransferase/8-amino-7-oxononanoate synthase
MEREQQNAVEGPATPFLMESPPGPETVINGRRRLYFGGVSYYGLHGSPQLMRAGIEAWKRLGLSTATTRSGMGTAPLHLEVEAAAARFFGTEDAAYVASGYLSNTAGIQVLHTTRTFDTIFVDQHAHPCVHDAALSVGVPVHRFGHLDPDDLATQLRQNLRPGQTPLVMSDGLFPTLGRIAPLPDYLEVLEPFAGVVWLDDAHPVGILGPNGRGTAEHFGLESDRVFSGGTLSKAFGGFGGIIPGRADHVSRIRGGPVMIAASPPPSPVAAATLEGIDLVAANPRWRQQLWNNAGLLKHGLNRLGFDVEQNEVPIAAFTLESAARMRQVHAELFERDIAIQYTHYPGAGSQGVLRVVVFSTHTRDHIERLIDELGEVV